MKILTLYRLGHFLHNANLTRAARFISIVIRILFSAEIPSSCKLGKNVILKHGGLGIVIHDTAVVGDNSIIFHNVTIGGRSGLGVPVIENNVIIGCGAVILGPIIIGKGSKIGANATVIHDVLPHSTIVGPCSREKQKKDD